MTQKELAAALNLNQSQVSRYTRRVMPADVDGAKAWLCTHVAMTMHAPLWRRQVRPMQRQVALSVAELVELVEDIAAFMDTGNKQAFDEGLPHLLAALGNLARLSESAVQALVLPVRVAAAVESWLAAP